MPPRLLVVENYEPARRFLCSILAENGEFEIAGQAGDGADAVRQAERLQPDIVLCDIGLSTLNGFEAAELIRDVAPHSKIVFVSQESSFDFIEAGVRAGALGYVQKMRLYTDLLPAIRTVLRGNYFISGVFREPLDKTSQHGASARHVVQFYSADLVLVTGFVNFAAAALDAGNAVIVMTTESHWETIIQRLKARRLDIDQTIQRGALVHFDVTESTCTVMASEVQQFFGGRVAFCRECPPSSFSEEKVAETLRLEQFWHDVAQRSVVDTLCAYAYSSFEKRKDIFESICSEHSAVFSF